MNGKVLKIIRRYCRLNNYNFDQAKIEYKRLDLFYRTKLMAEMKVWLKVNDKNYGKANVRAKSGSQIQAGK